MDLFILERVMVHMDTSFGTKDMMRICAVSRPTIIKWIEEGEVKAYRTPGGRYRVLREDLIEFLERYPVYRGGFARNEHKRVLIVDDQPDVRDTLEKALSIGDDVYRLDSAKNGFEALVKIGSFDPHLIVLDIKMPDMDGLELCERLKKHESTKHIKILGITAYPEYTEEMLKCGADECMKKPFQLEDLVRSVRKLTGV